MSGVGPEILKFSELSDDAYAAGDVGTHRQNSNQGQYYVPGGRV